MILSLILLMAPPGLSVEDTDVLNQSHPGSKITCPVFYTNAEIFAMHSGEMLRVKQTSAGRLIKKIHCYKNTVIPLTKRCIQDDHSPRLCKLRARNWWKYTRNVQTALR